MGQLSDPGIREPGAQFRDAEEDQGWFRIRGQFLCSFLSSFMFVSDYTRTCGIVVVVVVVVVCRCRCRCGCGCAVGVVGGGAGGGVVVGVAVGVGVGVGVVLVVAVVVVVGGGGVAVGVVVGGFSTRRVLAESFVTSMNWIVAGGTSSAWRQLS